MPNGKRNPLVHADLNFQKQIFYATWTLTSGSIPGNFEASVVVESRNADPTRLMVPVRMSEERPSPVRRRRGRSSSWAASSDPVESFTPSD
jgi:hypothetical protein